MKLSKHKSKSTNLPVSCSDDLDLKFCLQRHILKEPFLVVKNGSMEKTLWSKFITAVVYLYNQLWIAIIEVYIWQLSDQR